MNKLNSFRNSSQKLNRFDFSHSPHIREIVILYRKIRKKLIDNEFQDISDYELDRFMNKINLAYNVTKDGYYHFLKDKTIRDKEKLVRGENIEMVEEENFFNHNVDTTNILLDEYPDVSYEDLLVSLLHGITGKDTPIFEYTIENLFGKEIAEKVQILSQSRANVLILDPDECVWRDILLEENPSEAQDYVLKLYDEKSSKLEKKYYSKMPFRDNSLLKIKFADRIQELRNCFGLDYAIVLKLVRQTLKYFINLTSGRDLVSFKLLYNELLSLFKLYPSLYEDCDDLLCRSNLVFIDSKYKIEKYDFSDYIFQSKRQPEGIVQFYKESKSVLAKKGHFKGLEVEDIDEQMHKINLAYNLAKDSFYGQKREIKSERVFDHGIETARILMNEFSNVSTDEIIMGICHDIIEDTSITYETLRDLFGPKIADGVLGLSKQDWGNYLHQEEREKLINCKSMEEYEALLKELRKECKRNRRDVDYYGSLKDLPTKVLNVKFADRLHNLRTLHVKGPEDFQKKLTETIEYFFPLALKHNKTAYKLLREALNNRLSELKQVDELRYNEVNEKLGKFELDAFTCMEKVHIRTQHSIRKLLSYTKATGGKISESLHKISAVFL